MLLRGLSPTLNSSVRPRAERVVREACRTAIVCSRSYTTAAAAATDREDNKKKETEKLAPWQKWINYESPFKTQTDELNRKRHYFWKVDAKGRMLRRELHAPNETFGELKAPKARDLLLAVVKRNKTGFYIEPENGNTTNCFPFLAMRLHEHNFMQSEELSPIVYHDLVDSSDVSVCSIEGGALFRNDTDYFMRFGSELKHPFRPDQLFVSSDGKIYHSYLRSEVINPHLPKSAQQHSTEGSVAEEEEEEEKILGLLDVTLAQKLLSAIEARVRFAVHRSSSSSSSFISMILTRYNIIKIYRQEIR